MGSGKGGYYATTGKAKPTKKEKMAKRAGRKRAKAGPKGRAALKGRRRRRRTAMGKAGFKQ